MNIQKWQEAFERMDGILPFGTSKAKSVFDKIVKDNWSCDQESLRYSYGYYLITGRDGVWLYTDGRNMCVVCVHPNRPEQVLIYPSIGPQSQQLLVKLLNTMPVPLGKLQIARVESENYHADLLARQLNTNHGDREIHTIIKDEKVLDWLYPVRVLSTHKATEKTGADLHGVRKECRKIDQSKIQFLPYQGFERSSLIQVARHYTKLFLAQNQEYALSYEEVMQPILDVLDICLRHQEQFHIHVTWYGGVPKGYFVWELLSSDTANALWFLYDRSMRGLSYTQMVLACEHLKAEGINYVNFGGSETAGLDLFKRKFKPVKSFHMKSIDAVIQDIASTQSIKKAS